MKILLDTNVIIDYLTQREDKYTREAIDIMHLCASRNVEGYAALQSLSTICYVYRKVPLEISASMAGAALQSLDRRLCG